MDAKNPHVAHAGSSPDISEAGHLLRAGTLTELYPQLLKRIASAGSPVAPRGLPTLELLGAVLVIDEPLVPMFDESTRVLNPAFAMAEALWVAAGRQDAWIFDYNARLRDFADDGVLRGAYGPRLRGGLGGMDQLDRVRVLLRRDPSSRQAVVQLFDPGLDWQGARDVPCTVGYRFLVRDGKLHQHVRMRSQDAWLGLPYDSFTNAFLQGLLAADLGVGVGRCVLNVDSMHLYEHDLDAAADLVARRPAAKATCGPLDIRHGVGELDAILDRVLRNDDGLTGIWAEAAATLASYRLWRAGRTAEATDLVSRCGAVLGPALDRWYRELASRRVGGQP